MKNDEGRRKKKKLWKFWPFRMTEYREAGDYLNEMAAQGWAFKGLSGFFSVAFFEEIEAGEEPSSYRYCVDVFPCEDDEEKREDYLQLCRDSGWELLGEHRKLKVFRSDLGEKAVPLQTDLSLEVKPLMSLVRKQLYPSLVMCGIMLAALFILIGAADYTVLTKNTSLLGAVILLPAIVYYVSTVVGPILELVRFRRQIVERKPRKKKTFPWLWWREMLQTLFAEGLAYGLSLKYYLEEEILSAGIFALAGVLITTLTAVVLGMELWTGRKGRCGGSRRTTYRTAVRAACFCFSVLLFWCNGVMAVSAVRHQKANGDLSPAEQAVLSAPVIIGGDLLDLEDRGESLSGEEARKAAQSAPVLLGEAFWGIDAEEPCFYRSGGSVLVKRWYEFIDMKTVGSETWDRKQLWSRFYQANTQWAADLIYRGMEKGLKKDRKHWLYGGDGWDAGKADKAGKAAGDPEAIDAQAFGADQGMYWKEDQRLLLRKGNSVVCVIGDVDFFSEEAHKEIADLWGK